MRAKARKLIFLHKKYLRNLLVVVGCWAGFFYHSLANPPLSDLANTGNPSLVFLPQNEALRDDALAQSTLIEKEYGRLQFVSTHRRVHVDTDFHAGLVFDLRPGWHVYWQNPGGVGEPVRLWLQLDFPVRESAYPLKENPILWPIPKKIYTAIENPTPAPLRGGEEIRLPFVNYGFGGKFALPVSVNFNRLNLQSLEKTKTQDVPARLFLQAEFQVCKHVCIPEKLEFSLNVQAIPSNAQGVDAEIDERATYVLEQTLKMRTALLTLDAHINAVSDDEITLDIVYKDTLRFIKKEDIEDVYFFSHVKGSIEAQKPQIVFWAKNGWRLHLPISAQAALPLSNISGILRVDYKNEGNTNTYAFVVEAKIPLKGEKVVSLQQRETRPLFAAGISKKQSTQHKENTEVKSLLSLSLLIALLGAFLGGIVLNAMPCVFPIIALKALNFTQLAGQEKRTIKLESLFYSLGIVVSIMGLAALLFTIKWLGGEAGWGWQLQNTLLVACIAVLFFVLGLNLLGVFEVNIGLANSSNKHASGTRFSRGHALQAFAHGLLAVIVATPCSAPFMAGALGYALVQPFYIGVFVFLALGLGFALPFLLISLFPQIVRLLPKPGQWMQDLRQCLAFLMFGAVVWLVWLACVQNINTLLPLLSALLSSGFVVFVFYVSRFRRQTRFILACLGACMMVLCLVILRGYTQGRSVETAFSSSQFYTQNWSHARVEELRAQGKNVLVNFTADWCVSCKVNETFVLRPAQDLFTRTNTEILIADWTRKDDNIARELRRHGRAGIPLYVFYKAYTQNDGDMMTFNVDKGVVLPQILTARILETYLQNTPPPH